MKKAVILFIIFCLADFILFFIIDGYKNGQYFSNIFLPIMFFEIAVYGSFILYEVSKKGGDKK